LVSPSFFHMGVHSLRHMLVASLAHGMPLDTSRSYSSFEIYL